jgi:hypothetical protein
MQGVKLRYRVPLSTVDGVKVQGGPVGGSVYVKPWRGGLPVYLPWGGPVPLLPDPFGYPIREADP